MKRLIIALSICAATGLAVAAPASADPDTDFANELHTFGIYGQRDYNAWIAKIMCKRLRNGLDPDAFASAKFVHAQLNNDATTDPATRREITISGLIDLSVRHRRLAAVLKADPALEHLIQSREDLTELTERFTNLLLGDAHKPAGRAVISMVTNGVFAAVTDKTLEDVSDEDLRRTLLEASQQLMRTSSYFE